MHPMAPDAITPGDVLHDGEECTLVMCILYDADKHGYDNHDAINRFDIRLKTRRHAVPV